MKAIPGAATPAQLARAHAAARLRGTLADALRSPVLARCLEITAEALATNLVQRGAPHPQPAALQPAVPVLPVSPRIKLTQPRRDVKRESAGDMD
ncbi:hypothetical protein ACLRAJ_08385 [Bordetella avium]|uniref:hypothetical protein n=1 Tax=Bordetella avium TaxID=521 RepID=UPI0039FCA369